MSYLVFFATSEDLYLWITAIEELDLKYSLQLESEKALKDENDGLTRKLSEVKKNHEEEKSSLLTELESLKSRASAWC